MDISISTGGKVVFTKGVSEGQSNMVSCLSCSDMVLAIRFCKIFVKGSSEARQQIKPVTPADEALVTDRPTLTV